MIRILHIGMSSKLGGIEVFIMNLYRNINKEKFQFDFIQFGEEEICYKKEIETMGGKIYKVTPRRENILKNKKEIKKIIKENNYLIIHDHLNTLSYVTPIIIGLNKKRKVIVHSHNEWKEKSKKTLLLHKINYIRLYKKDIVRLACSNQAGKWIFGKQQYDIVKNGIDIDKFIFNAKKRKKIRDELNVDNNTVVIGNIGALRYQKNHEFMIDIFSKYLKYNLNSILVLVGDGELKNSIKQKVENLGISDKVKFMGIRNDADYFYSAFDCFLFPSIFEGLSIALIEAQAAGVKCLTSDIIPNQEAIVTNNVTTMSLKEDAESWAKAIKDLKLFDNRNIATTDKIYEYDVKFLVETMEKIYDNCVS